MYHMDDTTDANLNKTLLNGEEFETGETEILITEAE